MDKLEFAASVYRNLTNKNIHIRNRTVSGTLSESLYAKYKSQLEELSLLASHRDEDYTVVMRLPIEQGALFALSMEDLLTATSRLISPPKRFYLADINFLFTGEESVLPPAVSNYFIVSKFAATLLNIADHPIPELPKAIFLHGEKLELSLHYTQNDLAPLEGLDSFVSEFVDAEIHKGQKSTIIKGVLIEMLKNNEIDRLTITCLIKRFSEFLERVNANYQLYVSEFSFEKIKNKFETEKLELTIKLNKIISDIQNQLLAVPVALVIVGSQMEKSDSLTIKNISLWFGALVFGFLMSLLIRNQRNSLQAIKLEIESQWESIENKHRFVAERLNDHYLQLNNRFCAQKILLTLISFIVALSISASTIFFLFNSGSIFALKNFLIYGMIGGLIYIFLCFLYRLLFWIERHFEKASKVKK